MNLQLHKNIVLYFFEKSIPAGMFFYIYTMTTRTTVTMIFNLSTLQKALN